MNNEETKIPLFRRCVLQNFPFIEQDFDALTDYALLCKVVEYLNKVITATNENSAQVEALSVAFTNLKSYVDHYFDNLDVQEEINNKLDQMAEAGTLQEIITEYIQANVAWTFDTVADMKTATNLVAGSYARTLGFHTINDGGAATYYITDSGTANEFDVIAIDDLYANLVINDVMDIKQFGVKGDNTVESNAVKNAVLKMNGKQLNIIDVTVKVDDTITLPDNIILYGNGIIALDGDIEHLIYNYSENDKNIIIDGLTFKKLDENFTEYNRIIRISKGNLTVKNCKIYNYGTALHHDGGKHLVVQNLECYDSYGIAPQFGYGIDTSSEYVDINGVKFINEDNTYGRHAIYLNGDKMITANIKNIYVNHWQHNPINIHTYNPAGTLIEFDNILFNDTCMSATGNNPDNWNGNIYVHSETIGKIKVNNFEVHGSKTMLLYSYAQSAVVELSNLSAYPIVAKSESTSFGVYLRGGAGIHHVNNLFVDLTNAGETFTATLYARQNTIIADMIKEKGGTGFHTIISNASTLKCGFYYSEDDTPLYTVNDGTLTALDFPR